MIGFGEDITGKRCSRAGCTESATYNVNWRNPKIHGLDRVKVWLACDEHRDFLREFLLARNFPVLVTGVTESVEVVPDGAGS
ncbi:MAG: hypothetical protein ABWY54_07115 [Glaciihabitans sp.]